MKDIAFHITDVSENCIRAGATRMRITIILDGSRLDLGIEDNGCGMSSETIRRATDPFYTTRTTRKVGLGLPFLIQNAEQSGGGVEINSTIGEGTKVNATFMVDNIDCPPMGDLAETFMHVIAGNPDINTTLYLKDGNDEFEVSTAELQEIMGGVPLGHPEVATMIKDIIAGAIAEVFKGKLGRG